MQDPTLVLTPECIIVYPDLFEPTKFDGKGDPKYRATFLIDKDADMTFIREACKVAAVKKWPNQQKAFYSELSYPIHDGNLKALDDNGQPDESNFYFNKYHLNAKSEFKPVVVNIYNEELNNEEEVYGGCVVQAYLSFYGYKFASNLGIGVGLRAVCKIRDGEPLGGGRVDTKEVFKSVITERQAFDSKEFNELGQHGYDPVMDAHHKALKQDAEDVFRDVPPPGDEDDIGF